jgi:hypothetical protein
MASKIDAKSSQAWLQVMLEINRVLHRFAVVANPREVAHASDCRMHSVNWLDVVSWLFRNFLDKRSRPVEGM